MIRMTVLTAACALVAALPAVVAPAAAAGPAPYAALGDSYAAGVGAGPAAPGDCARTDAAYPHLWARAHRGTPLVQLACSGAWTAAVAVRQVPRIPRDARLVTLTAGGNDAGFAAVVAGCAPGSPSLVCRLAVGAAKAAAVTAVPVELGIALAAIRHRAPHAQVVVLGYPRLFEPGACPAGAPDPARRRAMNEAADLLDAALARATAALGATFVDVRGRFAGHGVCAPAGRSWINGPGDGPGAYHPNRAGQVQGYLPALAAVTG